jgi:hypothetical protein
VICSRAARAWRPSGGPLPVGDTAPLLRAPVSACRGRRPGGAAAVAAGGVLGGEAAVAAGGAWAARRRMLRAASGRLGVVVRRLGVGVAVCFFGKCRYDW